MKKQRYLSPKNFAIEIDTTPGALAMWRLRGQGPPYIRLSPKKILYDIKEVELYLARHKIRTDKEEE